MIACLAASGVLVVATSGGARRGGGPSTDGTWVGTQHEERSHPSAGEPGAASRAGGDGDPCRRGAHAAGPGRAGGVRHRGVDAGVAVVPALPRPRCVRRRVRTEPDHHRVGAGMAGGCRVWRSAPRRATAWSSRCRAPPPRSITPSTSASSSTACLRAGWCACPTPSPWSLRLWRATSTGSSVSTISVDPCRSWCAPPPVRGRGRAQRRRRPVPRPPPRRALTRLDRRPRRGVRAPSSPAAPTRRAHRRPAGPGVLVLEPLSRHRGFGGDRGRLRARAVPPIRRRTPSRAATRPPSARR